MGDIIVAIIVLFIVGTIYAHLGKYRKRVPVWLTITIITIYTILFFVGGYLVAVSH